MNVQSEELPPITWLYDQGAWPSFSTDGDQFVFTLGTEQSGFYLATMELDDNQPTILYRPDGASVSRPDWSWNSKSIAFACQEEGSVSLVYTIDPDGSHPEPYPISNQPADVNMLYPSWSKDTTFMIAVGYKQDKQTGPQPVIYKLAPNQAPIAWTQYPEVSAGRPSVSPDGNSAAFAGTAGKFNQVQNQIWIVTPPDTPYQLEPNMPISHNQGRSPNWSPDGMWIVFESTRFVEDPNTSTPLGIWIIAATGGAATKLVDSSHNASHPEWSRDQTKIIFNGKEGIGMIDVPEKFQHS